MVSIKEALTYVTQGRSGSSRVAPNTPFSNGLIFTFQIRLRPNYGAERVGFLLGLYRPRTELFHQLDAAVNLTELSGNHVH